MSILPILCVCKNLECRCNTDFNTRSMHKRHRQGLKFENQQPKNPFNNSSMDYQFKFQNNAFKWVL